MMHPDRPPRGSEHFDPKWKELDNQTERFRVYYQDEYRKRWGVWR